MTRLLILALIVVGVLWWLFGRKRTDSDEAATDQRAAKPPKPPKAPPKPKAPAQIVACAHCGVHLPREETVVDVDGRVFCGEPHRLAGPR